MNRATLHRLGLSACLAVLAGCADPLLAPDAAPQFAKPASSIIRARYVLPDAGVDLLGDGRGEYVDGVCGVEASIDTSADGVVNLALPTSTKGLPASCGPLRSATVRFAFQHLGYDANGDHIDAPVNETAPVTNMSLRKSVSLGDATKINVKSRHCATESNRGWTGLGMRFQATTYPGSNDLVIEIVNGVWHATAKWPNNIAYCEGAAGVTYWHVDVNLTIAPK